MVATKSIGGRKRQKRREGNTELQWQNCALVAARQQQDNQHGSPSLSKEKLALLANHLVCEGPSLHLS